MTATIVERFNLFGYLDGESARGLIEALWASDAANTSAIWEVCLNSEGGEMEAGTAIYSELVSYSIRGKGSHHVVTRVRGQAASCAALVLQAGDYRMAGRMDYLMMHEPLMSFADAPVQRVRDELAQAESWTKSMLDVLMERGSRSRQYYSQHLTGHDWWLSAGEALKLGLLDEIG